MVYQWKYASRVKADPNVAAEQFEQLTQTVGLTQQTVLVTAIVREPDKYELLLAQAKSEMAAYLNKYNTLKELQPFRDAFNAMV